MIANCSIMRGLFYHIPSNVSLFRHIKSLSIVSSLFSECCESYAWIKTKLHPTIAPTIVSVAQNQQDILKLADSWSFMYLIFMPGLSNGQVGNF